MHCQIIWELGGLTGNMVLTPASHGFHRCCQSVCREEQHAAGAGAVPDPDSDLSDDDWPAPAAAAPAVPVRQFVTCVIALQRPAPRRTNAAVQLVRPQVCCFTAHQLLNELAPDSTLSSQPVAGIPVSHSHFAAGRRGRAAGRSARRHPAAG
jgi:hypothetical protein